MPLCKLCKKDRELRESHFLPAAVYAQIGKGNVRQNPNPVVITSQISLSTSKQIKERVLCDKCEQLFSKQGETWVMANMARPESFLIQKALVATVPIAANESIAYYSSAAIAGINMDALVYFALSIFWRAAAHKWKGVSGFMEGIDLGPFEEAIRRFLLGGKFPADTVILVSVWPTKDVFPGAYPPCRGKAPRCHYFNFLIPGLEFKLFTGKQIPKELRAMCSYASAEKFIFSAMSLVPETMEAFTSLAATSRVAKGLQGITKQLL